MSRLEELIAELCPDGVEYKTLGEICVALKKGTLKQEELRDNGKYPVINSGRDFYGFYTSYNNEGDTICIASRGEYAGFVTYIDRKFWAGGLCYPYTSKHKSTIITKFIFYYLKLKENYIMNTLVARGSIPALNKSDIDKLSIPVPPLPVQEEIVRILDKFTELTADLTAELTKRKQQYQYYRQYLLKFSNDLYSDFSLCGILSRGEYITKKNASVGKIPVILGGQEPAYYIDKANHTGKAIVISRSGVSAGFISFWDEPIFVTDGFIVEAKQNTNIKFLYYYLKSQQDNLNSSKKGGGVPHITGKDILSISIPVPPLEEQQRIVSILDRFDALCNDLTSGLPAEIAARKKQYEYYRDKLLSFPEKPSVRS